LGASLKKLVERGGLRGGVWFAANAGAETGEGEEAEAHALGLIEKRAVAVGFDGVDRDEGGQGGVGVDDLRAGDGRFAGGRGRFGGLGKGVVEIGKRRPPSIANEPAVAA
jgi:hypothetical protein